MDLKKIFFSYSRTDASDFTLRLALDLKKEGFNVWIDQQDIRAGTEWDLEIEKALETCDCLLFIESEKSVVSNNVLDEVYYAMEHRKRVIPIIYHDSKTPFRIQRLQNIDFTKNYEKGLINLINELKREASAEVLQPAGEQPIRIPAESFLRKYARLLLIISSLLIIAAAVIFFVTNAKKETTKPVDEIISNNDTVSGKNKLAEAEATPEKEDPVIEEPVEKKATVKTDKTQNRTAIKPGNREDNKPATKENNKPAINDESKIENLIETFTGNWELYDVQPKAASYRGYLRIEELDEKKVNIQSNFQFYFFKTNDTAYFVVFNGYAACSTCVLKNEIKIIDKDIGFGTTKYEILRQDQAGVGKAGDTISTIGGNSTIAAYVSLHLLDKNTIEIKVSKPVATPVSHGFTVKPFAYTFRFRKSI